MAAAFAVCGGPARKERMAPRQRSNLKTYGVYAMMLGLAAAAYWTVSRAGGRLTGLPAALPDAAAQPGAAAPNALFHFLLALASVLALGALMGRLFRSVGQPAVIGEVIAGILLGPSFLGRVAPDLGAFVLPAAVAPNLGMVAQLGVILYMFQVGLDLNHAHLKGKGHATVGISHAGILLPFVLGIVLALWLYPRFATSDVPFGSFALFMGVAMAITAFPVLARILSDQGLHKTGLGAMALSCAAVDDATAWCLLALVVGVVQSRLAGALMVFVGLAVFVAVMVWLARPLLLRLARHGAKPTVMAVVLLGVLCSALATEWIGIHAVFGAFLLGVLIPHDSPLAREFEAKLKDVVAILLLPAFFAFTGMRTRFDLLQGWQAWGACGLIVLVATLGKFGGVSLAAGLSGHSRRDSMALGILMNTRGLVELIVLNMGLDLGVISPTLFAMMVLMALATTLATAPALRWLTPGVLPAKAKERGPAR
jgi:Kef-type K+ transport system membrane component KefB